MATKQQLEKMSARQYYRNLWHTDLMHAISADCPYCCFATFCAPCASYMLRRRALYNDMSRYVCCGGYMPCSGRCGESRCPEFCLCTEVFLCFANSVASTRFMLQDEFNIQTTKCDNCIIGFMFCLQQVACIFSIVAMIVGSNEIEEASRILSCLSDIVYCSVCACMQTQHKIEMDKRDGKFGSQPAMAVPPTQQMSRVDQPIPPLVGHPSEPSYGQPHGYPPPGQVQDYPAAGYPPPQAYPPHAYPPQAYPPQAYPPQAYPPQAHPPQAYPPQAYPPQAYPPPAQPHADR
eukprot:XP_010661835.1 PREDICTED: uncharacterized protein LOC100267039 isoform X3 [Vitis vinifera]